MTKPSPTRTHGQSTSKVYLAHRNLKQALTNPKSTRYPSMGGDGVTMPKAWLSFEKFIEAVGQPPDDEHCVPLRRNTDKPFSKANFYWGTAQESLRTRASITRHRHKGKLYTAAQLAEMYGINTNTLQSRLRAGWALEEALAPTEKK